MIIFPYRLGNYYFLNVILDRPCSELSVTCPLLTHGLKFSHYTRLFLWTDESHGEDLIAAVQWPS